MSENVLDMTGRLPADRRRRVADNGVIGMLIFVGTEIMFFAGLVSAFTIAKTTAIGGWPPAGQPRLPLEQTAINTIALMLSAVALYGAQRRFRASPPRALRPLVAAMALGAFFVLAQGAEWVALIREGLTMTTSTHGAFFYLIVGVHGLHAVVALGLLAWVLAKLWRRRLDATTFATTQIFWYFVVAVWPILYWRVYL
jgi:heme/copper-type cytochrome/quinol oxidase subunit 3